MKLEVGKFYKLGHGKSMLIHIKDNGDLVWSSHTPVEMIHISNLDFVEQLEEWREPIEVKGWVNVYSWGHEYFGSKEAADNSNRKSERIACIYVSGTQGVEL